MTSIKKMFLTSVISVLMIGAAVPVLAADPDSTYGLNTAAGKAQYTVDPDKNSISTIVEAVINGILALSAFAFFGLMLYSGIRWMTARGNEELAEKAKNNLESTILGMVIVALAYALTTFVFSKLGDGSPSPTGPTSQACPSGSGLGCQGNVGDSCNYIDAGAGYKTVYGTCQIESGWNRTASDPVGQTICVCR